MNRKKLFIMIFACIGFIVSGLCYSCSYPKRDSQLLLSATEGMDGSHMTGTMVQEDLDISQEQDSSKLQEQKPEEEGLSQKEQFYIHICGAVVHPGVYEVEDGARIYDLIRLSGGLTKEAAGDYINQARPVSDGERVYIPTKEEVKDLSPQDYSEGEQVKEEDNQSQGKVNINTAHAKDFMTLPGIGQAKADSIIAYRTKNGKFKTIEELMNITGIKEGVFEKIAPYITVK